MSITAIICEYNPFHNGHFLQLEEIRRQKGKDVKIISLMSGNTVQRGQLSIYPKHARAEAAVRCGVNLVLELPCPFSCGSAEYFARGAVALLDRLGIVDSLCFGSESGDLVKLNTVSENMRSPEFISAIKESCASESHQRSSEAIYGSLFGDCFPKTPNDILAVEYLNALSILGSAITPFTYRREEGFSASESRKAILSGEACEKLLPCEAQKVFSSFKPTSDELYSALALYTIRNTPDNILSGFFGMNGGVSGLLKNNANSVSSLSELITLCTCRKFSSARLRRAILAALLQVSDKDMKAPPLYSNLLAADAKGRELLAIMRKSSNIPIITKNADSRALSQDAEKQFSIGRRADSLLALARAESLKDYISTPPYVAKNN